LDLVRKALKDKDVRELILEIVTILVTIVKR
jgi:hypothetical protein